MTIKMSRKEFQDVVHEIAGGPIKEGRGKNAVYRDRAELQEEWLSGGQDGGNCWDDEPNNPVYHNPVYPDDEPALTELDNILLKVCPNIGLLQYRKVEQLIKYNTRHQSEYYGNYYIYSIKTIRIDELWDCLLEVGAITEK